MIKLVCSYVWHKMTENGLVPVEDYIDNEESQFYALSQEFDCKYDAFEFLRNFADDTGQKVQNYVLVELVESVYGFRR